MNAILIQMSLAISSIKLPIYLAAAIYFPTMQLLIWTIARKNADVELWRMIPLCIFVGVITGMGLLFGGIRGMGAAMVLGSFCAWTISGYLYDLETWQRGVVAVVAPLAAAVSIFLGYSLKYMIIGYY